MKIIDELNKKQYNIPEGISSEYGLKKYREVIKNDYAKYLDVLFRCGPFAMNQQLIEIVKMLDNDKNITDNHRAVEVALMVKNLEKLGFISTGFLNNYKYIYLKHPTYTLIVGSNEHKYRTNFKKDFNNETFVDSIMRVEYFLEYGETLDYSNMHNQLYEMTKMIYTLIIKNNNLYEYNIPAIENILMLGENKNSNLYRDIINYLNNTNEKEVKLGTIRVLWEDLGREYWKIGRLRNTISNKPYYLQLNHLDNGEITIHYVPEIIIFDTNKNYDYYKNRNNAFFYMFFNLPNNNTKNIANIYNEKGILGNKHSNILGYKVKIIGSNENALIKNSNVINKPYNQNEYSPMVSKCDYVVLDINKYFEKEKKENTGLFNEYEIKIEQIIRKKLKNI